MHGRTGRNVVRGVLALAGALLVAVACGDDGAGTGGSGAALPAAQLAARLLTVADVGASWQVGPEVNDADLGDAVQIPCEDSALNPTIAGRLRPVTGVQFEPVDRTSAHLIEFVTTGDPAQLRTDLGFYLEALDACARTTGPAGVTVDPVTLPKLGDQQGAVAARASAAADSTTTWYVRTAVVRVGATVVQIGLTEILATAQDQPRTNDATFVTLVRTAVDRLRG